MLSQGLIQLKAHKNKWLCKAKKRSGKETKENSFVQMLPNICGINKLKWPRFLRILKTVLNLEDVFKN